MPKPLSLDIRRRFQHCIEDGLSGRDWQVNARLWRSGYCLAV